MSSREGFSPRSRTWIKNSCATSVNTTKNPKPLNGSTSIQPIESLANQLLQLTRRDGPLAYAQLCEQLWNVLDGLLAPQLVELKPIARLSGGVVLRSALVWRVL